jgi:hypothetical protein
VLADRARTIGDPALGDSTLEVRRNPTTSWWIDVNPRGTSSSGCPMGDCRKPRVRVAERGGTGEGVAGAMQDAGSRRRAAASRPAAPRNENLSACHACLERRAGALPEWTAAMPALSPFCSGVQPPRVTPSLQCAVRWAEGLAWIDRRRCFWIEVIEVRSKNERGRMIQAPG